MNSPVAYPDLAVGMAGTFDIGNYGDLLFPLVAAAALKIRDRRIRVVPFSVNAKSQSSWPFQVRSIAEMISSLPSLSAVLIGGGQIVRFDKKYPIPVPKNVDMPVAYWLLPALHAALAGKPVIWNAVGAWTGSPRAPSYDELLRQAFASSYFVGVRDVVSRDHLAKLAPDTAIEILPDTAFSLSRLWPLEEESAEFIDWRTSLGLAGNYVVVQANAGVGHYRSTIESQAEVMGCAVVILPVCWCHGDRAEDFPALKGRAFLSREWLAPKLISEIIGRSEFVFASSLHACITALSYGVPGARAPIGSERKFELLDQFEGIVRIDEKKALSCLINRGHRTEPRVTEYADRLDRYWDTVRDVVLQPPVDQDHLSATYILRAITNARGIRERIGLARRTAMSLRKLIVKHIPIKHRVAIRQRLFLLKELALPVRRRNAPARTETIDRPEARSSPARSGQIAAMSPHPGSVRVLNFNRIGEQTMEAEPYEWAFIDRLFSIEDAELLAGSFPRDKFKKVKGNDGEKGYEYMSRSLIHMGASIPSYYEGLSPTWRTLAEDLLSGEYRTAVARVTGQDLSSAQMEVNALHYFSGSWLGPHLDLKEKIVTHVLYFNKTWNAHDGGCLNILRSSNPDDVVAKILPIVGNSSLLVRSNHSWHSVSRVVRGCETSRRSVNVTFYLPGSVSTMWPPGKRHVLQDYA